MGAIDWIRQWGPPYFAYGGYYLLPATGMVLAVALHALWSRRATERIEPAVLGIARGMALTLLVATASLSVVAYNNFFTFHYGGYLNAYEFYHYYLGSKYSSEIGYFDLYGATVAADVESGALHRPGDAPVRDLRSLDETDVGTITGRSDKYRWLFSTDRWQEWLRDVAFFRNRLEPEVWYRIPKDRGYNATPVWTMIVGGGLSNVVPTSNGAGMTMLALLDAALLSAAFVAVMWAFGARQALLMVIFLASSYLMAHVHMKGAFLRTDFVVALILAMCLLKKERYLPAGILVAYSTTSRIFPVVFAGALAVKLLWDLAPVVRSALVDARQRFSIAGRARAAARAVLKAVAADTRYLRFFGGFVATAGILFTASVLYAGSAAVWSDFATKITRHREVYHFWNVGLPTVFAGQARHDEGRAASEPGPSQSTEPRGGGVELSKETLHERKVWVRMAQIAIMVLWVAAVRGLADHDALAMGFVPVFVLASPTYYYYIVLLLPFLFLVERLSVRSGLVGVLYMLFVGMAGHWLYQHWDQYFTTYYWNSVLVLGLVLYLMAVALGESRKALASLP